MQTQTRKTRLAMACGFLPPAPAGMAAAWSFQGRAGAAPRGTTCIGYLMQLPEVDEIVRAWKHWDKSQLAIYAGQPTEPLLAGVEHFDSAVRAVQHWRTTPKAQGGGA